MIQLQLKILSTFVLLVLIKILAGHNLLLAQTKVLKTDKLFQHVNYFNQMEPEEVKNFVPNDQTIDWLSQNIPLFECPDSVMETTYYYRWWSFRKHLKQTPDGFIFTEFITP